MNHASLFSGIGGPEVAAAMLGWNNVFHCEINDFGRKILEYWLPESESYADIKKTDFTKWRGHVDVLTGGFPCQPFSYAGKRGGANDDRYLWPEFKRVISEVRPTWVIGENVAGITTMVEPGEVSQMDNQAALFDESDTVHRYQYKQPFTIERVCKDLEDLGYAVQPIVIPACAVGAPHRRDRVFIIANANERANGGRAGEDAGACGAERLQERHEIRITNEPNQVRPESANLPQNSMHGRQLHGQHEEQGSERNIGDACARNNERICGETSWIDTTDAKIKSGERMRPEQSEYCGAQQIQLGGRGSEDCGIAGCGRWANFPTVSPVHRGNDGLPFDVDYLTIPFNKWRTESLKAYGNAIVPQVMYEIFRAIEITTRQQ